MSPAVPLRRRRPVFFNVTVEEAVANGVRLGAPSVTVHCDVDSVCRVTYHWDHGDTTIYPTKENDMVYLGPLDTDEPYVPRAGDIGITQISDWGGAVIRAAQWLNGCGYADYEHAFGVQRVDPDGTVWIVEAMPNGARLIRNWHDPARTRWLLCPDGLRERMASLLRECARKKVPYSFADYGALAAKRLHLPGSRFLKHYVETSKHMICSQLVDWCADNSGWHLFKDHRWEGYVPPCDLNRLWASLPADARAGR